ETVISQVAGIPELRICLDSIESFLLQFVRVNFCREPDAASLLAHINQDAAAFLLNLAKRRVQLISAVAPARTKHVAGKALAVYTHQRWLVLVDLAFDQSEMMLAVEFRAIQMQIEITIVGGTFDDLLGLYKFLANATVGDQTLNCANAQAVFLAEFHQLRQPPHGAAVGQDFTRQPAGSQHAH